jgi:hypothetical protein
MAECKNLVLNLSQEYLQGKTLKEKMRACFDSIELRMAESSDPNATR